MEELEEFAVEDTLQMLDEQDPLLNAITSEHDLECHQYPWEDGLGGPGGVGG